MNRAMKGFAKWYRHNKYKPNSKFPIEHYPEDAFKENHRIEIWAHTLSKDETAS